MKINVGVPQGNVLGLVLFIKYINSICNMSIEGTIITHADDTCLLFSDNTWDLVRTKAITRINRLIQKLYFKKTTIKYFL